MNQSNTGNTATVVETEPLFASVWLALFKVLRKNYMERRLAATTGPES